jgi:hypothetical protein
VHKFYITIFFAHIPCSRTFILVLYYTFQKDEDVRMFRRGNEEDVKNLRLIFDEYENCTFKAVASTPHDQVKNLLSREGLEGLFGKG